MNEACAAPSPQLTVLAPAKVNLTLAVLARRPDGYHELESVMQALALVDRLDFWLDEAAAGPALEVTPVQGSQAAVPAGEENLVLRALRALEARLGRRLPLRLRLTKGIPAAAGLGGGSSDGAAALWGANRLLRLGLPAGELAEVAAGLGADVPFFLMGGTALARGKGEVLSPLPFTGPVPVVVAWPEVAVSTADVYGGLQLGLCGRRRGYEALLAALSRRDMAMAGLHLHNDLEAVTLARYPQVAALKGRLSALGAPALMSGSGAAVFALARSRAEAVTLARQVAGGGVTAVATAFSPRGVAALERGGRAV